MKRQPLQAIADFVYERGMLSKTPRSGLWFLGTGDQSVAEHTLRAAFIGWALAFLTPGADREKVMLLCLVHDLGEGRTSDLNYVHQKYGRLSESQAIDDISRSVPFGDAIQRLYAEFEARKTVEARLVKDADQLEWIATLREEEAKSNRKARTWARIASKRLKTVAGRKVGKTLLSVHPDRWWFDEGDKWFVDRKERDKRWRR